MKNYIYILILVFFVSGCSFIVSKAANIKDIKNVTGTYNIGTKRMVLTDSTRANWYTGDYGSNRKLMTQIWYPAIISKSDKKSNYIDNKKALTYTIDLQGYDVPEILSDQVGFIRCNSWEDAQPLSNQKFPVLIFSHGHGGLRTQNTNQVEELVSHGYIVIAIDHTFDAGFVEFPDGEVVYSLTSRSNDDPIIETPEQFYKRFGYRVDDVNFIIKQINSFNGIDVDIDAIMDKDNIGIFGHSFGGLTAFYATYFNDKIKSCYALDGWFEPLPDSLVYRNINKPVMHLGQNNKGENQFWNDINFTKMDTFIRNNSKYALMIDIPGSFHYDYTDFTYFTYIAKKLSFSGNISVNVLANIMNETLLDFFDHTLKDEKMPDAFQYTKKYNEINLLYLNENR